MLYTPGTRLLSSVAIKRKGFQRAGQYVLVLLVLLMHRTDELLSRIRVSAFAFPFPFLFFFFSLSPPPSLSLKKGVPSAEPRRMQLALCPPLIQCCFLHGRSQYLERNAWWGEGAKGVKKVEGPVLADLEWRASSMYTPLNLARKIVNREPRVKQVQSFIIIIGDHKGGNISPTRPPHSGRT